MVINDWSAIYDIINYRPWRLTNKHISAVVNLRDSYDNVVDQNRCLQSDVEKLIKEINDLKSNEQYLLAHIKNTKTQIDSLSIHLNELWAEDNLKKNKKYGAI